MNNTLAIGMVTGFFLLGLSLQPASAEGGHGYSKGHGEYSKGHGSGDRKGYGHGHGYRMGGHHATTGHLIRGLLSGAKEMGLTDDQVQQLKDIQLNLDRTRIKAEADIKIAEREARALVDNDASELSAIEGKLKDSAMQQVGLRVAAIKARRDAMAVLTPEQSERVKQFHEMMKERYRKGGKGHGQMKEGHRSSHPKVES